MPQCKAKSKRSGKRCRRQAMKGMEVCYMHGGKSATKGAANPNYKHGRYSRYNLAGKLQVAYEAALDDPDLASLRHELAALDAMVADMADGLDGTDRQALAKLRANQAAIRASIQAGDADKLNAAMNGQDELLEAGHKRMQLVFDLADLMEKRSRIAAREHRRMVQLDVMVRFDELLVRIGMLMEAVRNHVRDNTAIALIATEWQRILGPLPRGITESAGAVHDRSRSGDDDGPDAPEADGGNDPDAELRNAFQGAMRRIAAGPDERGSEAGGGSGD